MTEMLYSKGVAKSNLGLGHFLTFWYLTYYLNHLCPLQGYFLMFLKKLYLWLLDLMRHAKQSEARKFYDMSGEK